MQTFNIGKTNVRISQDQIVFADETELTDSISISSTQLPDIVVFLRSFQSNRHRFFRIPVEKQELHTSVKYGDSVFHVDPIDLSLTGILIASSEFQKKGYVHAIVVVALEFDEEQISLLGEIQSINGDCVGIEFIEFNQTGEQKPPSELETICRKLEAKWLSDAIRADGTG